jgi:predicted Zn-dependent peptidase
VRASSLAFALPLWLAACVGAPPPPVAPPPVVPPVPANGTERTPPPRPPAQILPLPNGITARVATAPGTHAQLQLAVFAGTLVAAPGLAELAAETLAETADASRGQQSLRQTIAALGGTLRIVLGPLTTWLEVRVPAARWPDAAAALRRALAEPTQSPKQLTRIRDDVAARRLAAAVRDPVLAQAEMLLLGQASPAAYIAALREREPSEISRFLGDAFRPQQLVLTVETPPDAPNAAAVLTDAGTGLGQWQPAASTAPPAAPIPGGFVSGLHWTAAPPATNGEVGARVALVCYLPDATRFEAADLLVLQACLTQDGVGGRLAREQAAAGLAHVAWQSRVVTTADATALVLTTATTPADAARLWQIVQRARASLRDEPPVAGELAVARRYAALTARLGLRDVGDRLRFETSLAVRGGSMASIERRLATIKEQGFADPAAAAKAFLELPSAMVVAGAPVPPVAGVFAFEVRPAPPVTAPTADAPADAKQTAERWLQKAIDAVGGATFVRQVVGFDGELSLRREQAPPATDTVRWRDDGSLRRRRALLGQVIETVLDGTQWQEKLGGETVSLTANEAAVLRREMQRHPLLLLAKHARGELTFRAAGERAAFDRTLRVLEADDGGFDRLRLFVDAESHLVRIVEHWETLPDGTVVLVQDAWGDYRNAGIVRAPFHRLTTHDEGQNRLEAVFTRFEPALRVQ